MICTYAHVIVQLQLRMVVVACQRCQLSAHTECTLCLPTSTAPSRWMTLENSTFSPSVEFMWLASHLSRILLMSSVLMLSKHFFM